MTRKSIREELKSLRRQLDKLWHAYAHAKDRSYLRRKRAKLCVRCGAPARVTNGRVRIYCQKHADELLAIIRRKRPLKAWATKI